MAMRFDGLFVLNPGTPKEIILPNAMTLAGCLLFYRKLFRDEAVIPTNLYIGLTALQTYTPLTATLTTVAATEVGTRQLVARGTSDWTVATVNNMARVQSKVVAFTVLINSWARMFLCDASSGTSGNLLAVSGYVPGSIWTAGNLTTGGGVNPSVRWEQWIRG